MSNLDLSSRNISDNDQIFFKINNPENFIFIDLSKNNFFFNQILKRLKLIFNIFIKVKIKKKWLLYIIVLNIWFLNMYYLIKETK